jgi:hypothetical protein
LPFIGLAAAAIGKLRNRTRNDGGGLTCTVTTPSQPRVRRRGSVGSFGR